MEVQGLLKKIEYIIDKSSSRNQILQEVSDLLTDKISHYDWVGFYLVQDGELVLGPYSGEPTEHTKINFGEGICGQAAEREKTFLVDDVSEESNYLSCSPKVKSEIVLPIFKSGEIVGELDIDSHKESAFGKEDENFLEEIIRLIEKVL